MRACRAVVDKNAPPDEGLNKTFGQHRATRRACARQALPQLRRRAVARLPAYLQAASKVSPTTGVGSDWLRIFGASVMIKGHQPSGETTKGVITVHDNTAVVEGLISKARQLSPQDRIYLLQQVAATFAFPGTAANGTDTSIFDRKVDLSSLASEQGVAPVRRFDDLLGDFWPEDDNVDEFIATIRAWRCEGASETH